MSNFLGYSRRVSNFSVIGTEDSSYVVGAGQPGGLLDRAFGSFAGGVR